MWNLILNYEMKRLGDQLLLTIEFKGNFKERDQVRQELAEKIFPNWQFLGYLDCPKSGKGTITFTKKEVIL